MGMLSLVERYNTILEKDGKDRKERITVEEALSTPDASILIPRVISDVMREAAEPLYIGSKFMTPVRLTEGRSLEFPSVGAIRAFDIAEGQELVNSSFVA